MTTINSTINRHHRVGSELRIIRKKNRLGIIRKKKLIAQNRITHNQSSSPPLALLQNSLSLSLSLAPRPQAPRPRDSCTCPRAVQSKCIEASHTLTTWGQMDSDLYYNHRRPKPPKTSSALNSALCPPLSPPRSPICDVTWT